VDLSSRAYGPGIVALFEPTLQALPPAVTSAEPAERAGPYL
jgi:hypothetical protein